MSLKLIKRKGSPYYYVRGTVRGQSVFESTGVTEQSAAEAIRDRRTWELQQASIYGRKSVASFLEPAVSYMESGGERRFLRPLIEHFKTTPLSKIDQAAIDRAARTLYPKAAPATLNRQVYTPMSAILRHAAEQGLCEYRLLKRPKQPRGRVRWVTPEEADRLIAACTSHARPLVIFLFYTGARLSEALYLDWKQVNLSLRQVEFVETKNGEARGVPLHPRVLEALAALRHRAGAVFRRPDGKEYARKCDGGGQIKTAFRGACRRAGIDDFSPHDCRHTWATWHYAANRDLRALMELGGWQSEKMVLRYTHVNVGHLAHSIEALPWAKPEHTRVAK